MTSVARSIIPPTRLDGSSRSVTLSPKRMGKSELIRMRAENDRAHLAVVVDRPRTRGDCVGGPRPCPFAGCRFHLYIDVHPTRGSMKINFPDIELEDMAATCALDVADLGTERLEDVGEHMNLTRERVRQLAAHALARLVGSGEAETLRDYIDHEAPRQISPLGVAQDRALSEVRYRSDTDS